MRVYRIRDTILNLYSTGGSPPGWDEKGKIWKRKGHIRSHLRSVDEVDYEDAVIEEYELNPRLVRIHEISSFGPSAAPMVEDMSGLPKVHLCTVCRRIPVDAEHGFDTCVGCVARV